MTDTVKSEDQLREQREHLSALLGEMEGEEHCSHGISVASTKVAHDVLCWALDEPEERFYADESEPPVDARSPFEEFTVSVRDEVVDVGDSDPINVVASTRHSAKMLAMESTLTDAMYSDLIAELVDP